MMNRILFITALLLSWNSASVWADGEDRSEAGTQWVDPVAFYDLMDIEGSDFKPDYDQGNVDVVNVMMKRGLKLPTMGNESAIFCPIFWTVRDNSLNLRARKQIS